jgi:parallel beta-helix repeat protein
MSRNQGRIFNLLAVLLTGALLMGSAAALAANLLVPSQYATIQAAMDAAGSGDVVLVAPGTYNDCTHPTEGPESTPACVIMKSGVTLRGNGATPSDVVIDAQGLGRGIFIELVNNCAVENLTVTGAFADIYGGGMLIREVDSTVTITDCRVVDCDDGGIICIDNAHPEIRGTIMSGNLAKQGGGLAIEEGSSPLISGCRVTENEAPSGAGIFIRTGCAPTIENCTIDNNTINAAYGNGGGICVQDSAPTITGCHIYNNVTLGYGGGVAFVSGGNGSMTDCVVSHNDAGGNYSQGGGIATSLSAPVLNNVTIVSNTCTGYGAEGGGLDISFAPAPSLTNCTIADNATSAQGFGGGLSVQWGANPIIEKCIISGSTVGSGLYCSGATPVVSCTNIWGNAGGDELCGTDDGGNFSADPLFCGTVESPYNLQEDSPCLTGCGGELVGANGSGCGTSHVMDTPRAEVVLGNLPNPFNPRTTIFFELPGSGPARLSIYDVAGRLIQECNWSDLPAGRTEYQWDGKDRHGRNVTSGVYFYRLDSRDYSANQRMSLIR